MSISVASGRIGHSKTSITLDMNTHPLSDTQGMATDAIERAEYWQFRDVGEQIGELNSGHGDGADSA